jgi:hypothetical protein
MRDCEGMPSEFASVLYGEHRTNRNPTKQAATPAVSGCQRPLKMAKIPQGRYSGDLVAFAHSEQPIGLLADELLGPLGFC